MAVRSILQIDVQDAALKTAAALFEKYKASLKDSRLTWVMLNREIGKGTESYEKMVRQAAVANQQERLRIRAQAEADRLTRTTAERWQQMARTSGQVLYNIREGASWLLKWASISGLVSGLVGAGGLFGYDRLAGSAASSRRTALGLGVGIGELSAFGSNAGRFVDPAAFLEQVAGAKFDVNKRVGLLGAGLTQGQIDQGDTVQTSIALLRRLKNIADTTNPALFGQILQARRLDQFAGPTDLNRLRNTSAEEFEQIVRQIGQRGRQFDISDPLARKYQDLVTQLDNAGKAIETTLIRGLVGLAPGLTKLSESVSKVVGTLVEKGGPLERWVNALGNGLERFADYVGTPEFQESVRLFVAGIEKIGEKIAGVISWFGDSDLQREHQEQKDRIQSLRRERAEGKNSAIGQLGQIFGVGTLTQDQLLAMVGRKEGGTTGQANVYGAVGRYQIKPGTAAEHGIDPSTLYTAEGNEAAARKILRDYSARYHGNLNEILAAYNQGTGAGDAYRRSGDNPASLKPEGQKYISGSEGMRVRIEDSTGGSVNISTNALKD